VLLVALIAGLLIAPAVARSPTIKDIQPDDTIFVYEENLNLVGLRDPLTNSPITSLRRYSGDDPLKALISEIPVDDDTDFDLVPGFIDDFPAVYFAYNPTDGTTAPVLVREPTLAMSATLASPYHGDLVEGLSLPVGTDIAFRITSPYVGSAYHAGSSYPATVDIVVTTPGGAETTVFGGRDLGGLPVASSEFYTDDPGYPGPIALSGLSEGTYRVRAEWSSPQEFADNAPDSNEITFTVKGKVGVDTTPTTAEPTSVPTTMTPVTTATPATPLPTTPPVTVTETTAVPTTEPTAQPTPTEAAPGLLACAGAVGTILLLRRRI
jgi:hypothetical protein